MCISMIWWDYRAQISKFSRSTSRWRLYHPLQLFFPKNAQWFVIDHDRNKIKQFPIPCACLLSGYKTIYMSCISEISWNSIQSSNFVKSTRMEHITIVILPELEDRIWMLFNTTFACLGKSHTLILSFFAQYFWPPVPPVSLPLPHH